MKWMLLAAMLIADSRMAFSAPLPAKNCDDARLGAQLGYDYDTVLAETRKLCRKGETISWPAGFGALIGATCDMSKSVITAAGRVTCVFKGR